MDDSSNTSREIAYVAKVVEIPTDRARIPSRIVTLRPSIAASMTGHRFSTGRASRLEISTGDRNISARA